MGLRENVQEALDKKYSSDEIWSRIKNDPRITEAISKKYTEQQIRKRLGLSSDQVGAPALQVSPDIAPAVISPDAAGATIQSMLDPKMAQDNAGYSPDDPRQYLGISYKKPMTLEDLKRGFPRDQTQPIVEELPYGLGSISAPWAEDQASGLSPREESIRNIQMLQEVVGQETPAASFAVQNLPFEGMTPDEERLWFAREMAQTAPESLMGQQIALQGQAAYLPQKALIEYPLSDLFGAKDYQDLAGKMGLGKWGAFAASTAARLISSAAFWAALGKMVGEDPVKFAMGESEANKVRTAINNHDWKTVAEAFKNNPGLVQKATGKNLSGLLRNIRGEDPGLYDQLISGLKQVTTKGPVTAPTPPPAVGGGYAPLTSPATSSIFGGVVGQAPPPPPFPVTATALDFAKHPINLLKNAPPLPPRNPVLRQGTIFEIPEIPIVKSIPGKAPVNTVSTTNKEFLEAMRGAVEAGLPGYPGKLNLETNIFAPGQSESTYPEWMQNKGLTKDGVLKVIDKLIAGEKIPNKNVMEQKIAGEIRDELGRIRDEEISIGQQGWKDREKLDDIIAEEGQSSIYAEDLPEGGKIDFANDTFTVKKTDGKILLEDGTTLEVDPYTKIKADFAEQAMKSAPEPIEQPAPQVQPITPTISEPPKIEAPMKPEVQPIPVQEPTISPQDQKILDSKLASPAKKSSILINQIEDKAIQTRITVPTPPVHDDDLTALYEQKYPHLKNLDLLAKIPEEFQDDINKDAGIFREIEPFRHVARRNPLVNELIYKPVKAGSLESAKFSIDNYTEAKEVAKQAGLNNTDLRNITLFREGKSKAELTPGQKNLDQWLDKRYEKIYQRIQQYQDLNDIAKKIGHVDKYSPRLRQFVDAIEDKIVERVYPGHKIPKVYQDWFTKNRLGGMKDTELNALKIFERYTRSVGKYLYLADPVNYAMDKVLPSLPPAMMDVSEKYLRRIMGYPDVNNAALYSTFSGIGINPGKAMQLTRMSIDLSYMGLLGGRLTPPIRNLLQTLNNSVPQLGYSWTATGLGNLLTEGFKPAKDAGILLEWAPELYKELGEETEKMDRLKNALLYGFSKADEVNRSIVFYGSVNKFDHFYKGYMKHGLINQFMKQLEADKLDKTISYDIRKAMQEGKPKTAKDIFAKELTGMTQYLYNKEDSPVLTRHLPGKMALQFWSWPINYAELLGSWGKNKNYMAAFRSMVMSGLVAAATKKLSSRKKKFVRKAFGLKPLTTLKSRSVVPPVAQPLNDALWILLDPKLDQDKMKKAFKRMGSDVWNIYVPGGLAMKEYYGWATKK